MPDVGNPAAEGGSSPAVGVIEREFVVNSVDTADMSAGAVTEIKVDAGFSVASNELVVAAAGIYQISVHATRNNGSSAGTSGLMEFVAKDGTTAAEHITATQQLDEGNAGSRGTSASIIKSLSASDTLDVNVANSTDGSETWKVQLAVTLLEES